MSIFDTVTRAESGNRNIRRPTELGKGLAPSSSDHEVAWADVVIEGPQHIDDRGRFRLDPPGPA